MFRTLFTVRGKTGEVYVDSGATWEEVTSTMEEIVVAANVVNRMEGNPVQAPNDVLRTNYPDLWSAMQVMEVADLRMRFNNDMAGPFLIVTEHKPTDEELVALYKAGGLKKVRV